MTSLATDALLDEIAAAFHTLIRGWYYDPTTSARPRPRGQLPLEPWVVPTVDPTWLRDARTTVDLAATWWEDLPDDWQERFRMLARRAADTVLRASAAGLTPIDLANDEAFIRRLGAELHPDWLAPPRVIALGGERVDIAESGRVLGRVAVYVYARRLAGFQATLGTVPTRLPSDPPQPGTTVKVGGARPDDRKYVSFNVRGERLRAEDRSRLTAAVGREPESSWSRGALNLAPATGKQYRPYQSGLWTISTRGELAETGNTLEDHILSLLEVIEPSATAIQTLVASRGLTLEFGCYYAQRGLNAEWTILPSTIRRIADLGASFWFDSYAQDESDD